MGGTLEVGGGSAPGLRLSVSQITKFLACENRWLLTKTTPAEDRRFAKSEAMDLGTLMHALLAAWRSGRSWREEWVASAIETIGETDIAYEVKDGEIVERPGWEVPRIFLRALPIMRDWELVRGSSPATDPDPDMGRYSYVATELPFDIPVPGVPDARIIGFIDALVTKQVDDIRVHDQPWIVEDKTMGRWGRENQVPFDLQLNVYLWAAKQMFDVQGAVFEAVSTYAYKQGTPDIRFKRLFLPYDKRLVDRTMQDVTKVARRMKTLLKNPGLAIRSVGEACTYCDFKRQCLTPWET